VLRKAGVCGCGCVPTAKIDWWWGDDGGGDDGGIEEGEHVLL
jgi:hypothetical protein